MDIRKKGNIITHEKRIKVANTETISKDTIRFLRNKSESHRDNLNTTYRADQSMQSKFDQLGYKTETTKKLIELAELKVKELEQNLQNYNDDAEVNIKISSNGKRFQESLPHIRVTENTQPDVEGLEACPPCVEISLVDSDASKPEAATRNTSQEKNTT